MILFQVCAVLLASSVNGQQSDCSSDTEGSVLVQKTSDFELAFGSDDHVFRGQPDQADRQEGDSASQGAMMLSTNMRRGLMNVSLVVEAALSAGLHFSLSDAEDLVEHVQEELKSQDVPMTNSDTDIESATDTLTNDFPASPLEITKEMTADFLFAISSNTSVDLNKFWQQSSSTAVTVLIGLLSLTNPLLAIAAGAAWGFFSGADIQVLGHKSAGENVQ
jgi:hypothetical protein